VLRILRGETSGRQIRIRIESYHTRKWYYFQPKTSFWIFFFICCSTFYFYL